MSELPSILWLSYVRPPARGAMTGALTLARRALRAVRREAWRGELALERRMFAPQAPVPSFVLTDEAAPAREWRDDVGLRRHARPFPGRHGSTPVPVGQRFARGAHG